MVASSSSSVTSHPTQPDPDVDADLFVLDERDFLSQEFEGDQFEYDDDENDFVMEEDDDDEDYEQDGQGDMVGIARRHLSDLGHHDEEEDESPDAWNLGDEHEQAGEEEEEQQQQRRRRGRADRNFGFQRDVPKHIQRKFGKLNPTAQLRYNQIMKKRQDKLVEEGRVKMTKREQKRRMLLHWKEYEDKKKKESRVTRPLPLGGKNKMLRTPLACLQPGLTLDGTVISLTNFGAYVDIGSQVDGLVHISQFTRNFFVQHPRQLVEPGQKVKVTILMVNPEQRKLQLSMLPKEEIEKERDLRWSPQTQREQRNANGAVREEEDDEGDLLMVDDLEVNDELWGTLVRVTDYGAYVNVGAEVLAFLHFMDHPWFEDYDVPSEFLRVGDKVRVWVSRLTTEEDAQEDERGRRRIQVTAHRPRGVPGPRRDVHFY